MLIRFLHDHSLKPNISFPPYWQLAILYVMQFSLYLAVNSIKWLFPDDYYLCYYKKYPAQFYSFIQQKNSPLTTKFIIPLSKLFIIELPYIILTHLIYTKIRIGQPLNIWCCNSPSYQLNKEFVC